MTRLIWDQDGSRLYESGLDRVVLFVDGIGIPWNGLQSVNEAPSGGTAVPVWVDGEKTYNGSSPENLSLTITAFTYPDVFEECDGTVDVDGMLVGGQKRKPFNLVYRTMIPSDIQGAVPHYKIHLVYGCYAAPSSKGYETTDESPDTSQFAWSAPATSKEQIPGYRATSHLIVDTRLIPHTKLLSDFEDMIYGTADSDPVLPTQAEVAYWFGDWVWFRITVNDDGTWTASGPDQLFSFPDEHSFVIDVPTVEYLDSDTYTIESYTP